MKEREKHLAPKDFQALLESKFGKIESTRDEPRTFNRLARSNFTTAARIFIGSAKQFTVEAVIYKFPIVYFSALRGVHKLHLFGEFDYTECYLDGTQYDINHPEIRKLTQEEFVDCLANIPDITMYEDAVKAGDTDFFKFSLEDWEELDESTVDGPEEDIAFIVVDRRDGTVYKELISTGKLVKLDRPKMGARAK